jgi:surfactin family lipopeptide synthetase A
MSADLSEDRKALLQRLLRGVVASNAEKPGVIPRLGRAEAPLSYGQQQIWLHSQLSAPTPIYNELVTIHHFGALDRMALERALTETVRRHEAWRTTFVWKSGELVQCIEPPLEHIEIPYLDVSDVPLEGREETALRAAKNIALAPYDLAIGPMYRPFLVRFTAEQHRLFLGLHHIIFDGVSLYGVLLPEMQTLYEAYSENRPSPLEELPLQYTDYAVWHREWVDEIACGQLEYWRSKLDGATDRTFLPTDHPRAETQSYGGATELLSLSAEASVNLKHLSERSGVTLFMVLLATFFTFLWAYTREEDLIIGCTSSGRTRTETAALFGFFLNSIALRTNLAGDPTFLEVLQRSREELLSSLDNDGVPFQLLVNRFSPQRSSNKHPFFQILFAFQPPLAPLKPEWKFTQMDCDLGVTKFDLHLELDEREEGIVGRIMYSADLFERETIRQIIQTWQEIVHLVINDPSQHISQLLPLLSHLPKSSSRKDLASPSADAAVQSPKPNGLIGCIQRFFRTG